MTQPTQQELQKAITDSIRSQSQPSRAYWTMNALATVIASYGLFTNSPAVVIGAMVVALLLGPIAGLSLGLMDKDNALIKTALLSLAGGVAWILLIAFIIGFIHRTVPLTHEIVSRTDPTLFDMMVALAGGAAGAIAIVRPQLGLAMVGVAIATALVPPLSATSILLARGEWVMAGGAFTLAFTNIVAIQFSFSTVLWLNGYRRVANRSERGFVGFLRRDIIDIVFLAILAVILSYNLHNVVAKELFETRVRSILAERMKPIEGLYLAQIRIETENNITFVRAVARGPAPPSAAQVAAMQAVLPLPPNGNSLELRVRFIRIEVITAHGAVNFNGKAPFEETE